MEPNGPEWALTSQLAQLPLPIDREPEIVRVRLDRLDSHFVDFERKIDIRSRLGLTSQQQHDGCYDLVNQRDDCGCSYCAEGCLKGKLDRRARTLSQIFAMRKSTFRRTWRSRKR